jgi:hypothetical protein
MVAGMFVTHPDQTIKEMNRFVLISLLIMAFLPGYPQYLGGDDDGFSILALLQQPLNGQEFYCSGGSNDGFSLVKLENHTLNDQVFYCSGGNSDGSDIIDVSSYLYNPALCFAGGVNDGFAVLSPGLTYICDPSIYASGGNGDGFHNLTFSGPIYHSPAWIGGISDGFSALHSLVMALAPTFFCLGGDNDGAFSLQMPASYFGKGIWLGTANTSWNNPANWSINYVPDLSVNVLISAGRSHYPLILSGNLTINNPAGSYKCNSLTIREGGSLFNKSNLYIFGDVTISGLYQADDPSDQDVVINPGGNLKLISPGVLKIGE